MDSFLLIYSMAGLLIFASWLEDIYRETHDVTKR